MPFVSRRQARWAFANSGKMGGLAKVKEWARKTDFKHLPESVRNGEPANKLGPPKRRKRAA